MALSKNIRVRYLTVATIFISAVSLYTHRVNIGVAIVSMTSQGKNQTTDNSTGILKPQFTFSESEQGWLLASFFVGYLVSHIPGVLFMYEYGSRNVMLACISLSSMITIITPLVADYLGFYGIVFSRITIGIFNGPLISSFQQLVGAYALPSERTKLHVYVQSGNLLGMMLNNSIGAILLKKFPLFGWRYLFYATGLLGVLSSVLWSFFVYTTPELHKLMSNYEKQLIKEKSNISKDQKQFKFKEIPFKKILSSPLLYIFAASNFGKMLIVHPQVMGLTKYLRNGRGFSPFEASLYSLIPFVCDFVSHYIFPPIIDYLIGKKIFSRTTIRKGSSFIGVLGSCLFLGSIYFVGNDKWPTDLILISFSLSFTAFLHMGYFVCVIELCPPLTGFTMAVINIFGSFSGVVALQLTSAIISKGVYLDF